MSSYASSLRRRRTGAVGYSEWSSYQGCSDYFNNSAWWSDGSEWWSDLGPRQALQSQVLGGAESGGGKNGRRTATLYAAVADDSA